MDLQRYIAAGERFNSSAYGKHAFSLLVQAFGNSIPIDIVENASNNLKLFRLYHDSICEKFMSLHDALAAFAATDGAEKVLIHFSELNLYGLFTPDRYMTFTHNLWDRIEDGARVTFRPKQIILTGLPQKLVFVCLGDSAVVEKIRGYVAKKYHCDITSVKNDDRTEITVQGMGGNNYEEAQSCYYDLFNFISDSRRDTEVAKKMLPMPITKAHDKSFIAADVSYDLTHYNDIKDIVGALKTIHGENIVVNLTIVNGTCNVNNNYVRGPGKKDQTRAWIASNPPNNREKKTDYYARYSAAIKEAVPSNVFTQIVEENKNYASVRTHGVRMWEVKK